MRPAWYEQQWHALRSAPDSAQLKSLSHRIASTFVDRCFYSDEYNERYITLICEMATCFEDPNLNQIAARALFGVIVERLCDDFEELQTETYNRLICQVTGFLRRLPDGKRLDDQLKAFHLHTDEQLYERIESMRLNPDQPLASSLRPKKVLVLSRVTIGADVAITSVICQRLLEEFPEAEIVVLGNAKLRQIMAPVNSPATGIRIRKLNYARHGGLIERFSVWLDLVAEVQEEIGDLGSNEYLVLDPDSRLTQLGVLPLVPESSYRFFNSRGKQGYPARGSISELTNIWLNRLLGQGMFHYPRVWLDKADCDLARAVRERFNAQQARRIITLNLGVGGNMRKRVTGEFEAQMVLSLLREPGTLVFLDMGFGDEELMRSRGILAAAQREGVRTHIMKFADLGCFLLDANALTGQVSVQENADLPALLGIECDVGEIAALITISDEFIGYDSACQHIAAAVGVPAYTVFAGTSNARFIRRWHACGPTTSEILYVDTQSCEGETDVTELIERLRDLRQNS